MNTLCVFAVSRGKLKNNSTKRIDTKRYDIKFEIIRNKLNQPHYPKYQLKDLIIGISGGDWGIAPEKASETHTKCLVLRATEIDNNDNINIREDKAQYRQIEKKKLTAMNVEIGDIIIEKSGGSPDQPVGRVIYVDKISYNGCPIAYSNFMTKIKVNKTLIDPYYLFEYLRFVYRIGLTEVMQNQTNGIRNLILEEFLEQTVVVPENNYEIGQQMKQRRICIHGTRTQAEEVLSTAKAKVFDTLRIDFPEYKPSLFSHTTLDTAREMGVYCNPHSDYLNSVFARLKANKYYAGDLEDFAQINPTTSRKDLSDNTAVSFVPMLAVTEKINEVIYEQRRYVEVKTGFTIFQKGDLLWAKITPCMQNGKSFLADGMSTEIGFGSTEFHVLRKKSERIYMPFLWVLLSDEHILEAAQGMFGGSAGQQRVPDTFLQKFPIVLPPIEIQKELADNVFVALSQAKQLRKQADHEWQEAKAQFKKVLLSN